MSIEKELKIKQRGEFFYLIFGFVSIAMIFAGLTSAYIVRHPSTPEDPTWLRFDLPPEFAISTALILVSSVLAHLGYTSIKKDKCSLGSLLLLVAVIFGAAFCYNQYDAFFNILPKQGLFFTGEQSSVSVSFIGVIAFMHIAHVLGGLGSLIFVTVKSFFKGYSSKKHHRLFLTVLFWHFLGILWLYLFLFLYFVR